jgi:cytoskeleton protein RodZ
LTELVGVGAALRQAREARGLAVDDVAQQLKFASRQIESLENERFDRLPGPTIARGMVRNYARLLKIDPEPLLDLMAPRVEKAPDPARIAARYRQPVPFADGAKRSTLIYGGFSLGILVLVGAVAFGWQQDRAAPQFVAPAQTQRPQPEPATTAAASTVLDTPVVQEKAPPPEENKIEEKKIEEKKPEPRPESRPLAAGVHQLTLRCEVEAWLEVRDGAGRLLVSSLNPAGSERTVRGRPPFELVIGNASGVSVIHNGKPVDIKPFIKVEVARFTLK